MDIASLRAFYTTPLGRAARRMVARAITARIGDVSGRYIVGLGYAVPYLGAWRNRAGRVIALMPARLGVTRWPPRRANLAALVEEARLPLADATVDLVVVVHAVELSDDPAVLLRQVWRVLKPEGRALLVVPNRRGMWARFDTTPFGFGRPYSTGQLEQLLAAAFFEPVGVEHALCAPPLTGRLATTAGPVCERLGLRLWRGFSGVIIIEAIKRVYGLTPDAGAAEAVKTLRPVAAGLPRTLVS